MTQVWETNNRKMALLVSIKCTGKCVFRVEALGPKPNTKYASRVISVEGYRTIELKFPVTPKELTVKVELIKHETVNRDFIVQVDEKTLTEYDILMDDNTRKFLGLVIPFAMVAGYERATPEGRVFAKNGYVIKYFTRIRDYRSGRVLNTPARIGHNSGIIENSEDKMIGYTVAQRAVIDLHEFSHVWKNPCMGLPVDHEQGADINALYIYMGLGFSKVDAILVFAKVFYGAQTDENIARMRKIYDFIQRFENGEFAKRLT